MRLSSFCCVVLSVLRFGNCRWELEKLRGQPIAPEGVLLDNVMDVQNWGCLYNTHLPHDSKNKWHEISGNKSEAAKDPHFLHGTTIWINEWMAVGHVMYDLAHIQVFESMKVDRIVLQRSACYESLCHGVGTFDGWYMGFYMSMIEAFQPGIPVFVRWTWQEKKWGPLYLSSNTTTGYYEPPVKAAPIIVKQATCLERVVRHRCKICFYPGVGPSAVQKFKKAAYHIVSESKMKIMQTPLPHHFTRNKPIVVTLAHRGLHASRHVENVELLVDVLIRELPAPQFEVRAVNTSNPMWMFNEQIKLMAESQVVICEHGAFQSNTIYMRNGSLLIDMRGNYTHGEFKNFENIARMFGVHYATVTTKGLKAHWELNFPISDSEAVSIAQIVKDYAADAPYMHNVLL